MIVALLYVTLILILAYYWLTKNLDYWERRRIPNDKPFLFFGSFYEVATRKQHIFDKISSIYKQFSNADYAGFHIFYRPTLMVRNPELIKKILVKDFDKFQDRPVASDEKADPLAFHSLFGSKGAQWRAMRSKITPVFTSGKMKLMFPLMQECSHDLVESLSKLEGRAVLMRPITKRYSVDIISSCAFGIRANCLKKDQESEIQVISNKLLDLGSFKRAFSIFSFFFVPKLFSLLKLTFVDKEASDYLFNVFKDTLRTREQHNIVRHDLIDLLNNLKKSEGSKDDFKFDDVKMAAQAVSFFSAGNDTTSSTISFTLYELALDKGAQERLRQEVTETFAKYGDFTYEALQGMKYLDMVVSETLRKYPLTTFLNREATSDYILDDGFKIEKNTNLMIPVCGLHYDPKYFPNPQKFDPERFSDENKANIVPYTYMPFGEGPRNCIGQRFGLLVTKIAVAQIVKNYILEKDPSTPVPIRFVTGTIFLMSENDIPLRLYKI